MFIVNKNPELPKVEISVDVSNQEYGIPERYWSKDFSYLHMYYRFEDFNTVKIYIFVSFVYGPDNVINHSFDFDLKDYIRTRGKVSTLTGDIVNIKKLRVPLKNKFNYVFGSIDLDIDMDSDEDSEAKEIETYAHDYSLWKDCWLKSLFDWLFKPKSGVIREIGINWDVAIQRPDDFPHKPVVKNFSDFDVEQYLDWSKRDSLKRYGIIYDIYRNGWNHYMVSYRLNGYDDGYNSGYGGHVSKSSFVMTVLSGRLDLLIRQEINKLEQLCDSLKGIEIIKEEHDSINNESESFKFKINDFEFNNKYGTEKSGYWGQFKYIGPPYFMIVSKNFQIGQYETHIDFNMVDKMLNYFRERR